jgi:hypothetical protein
MSINTAAAQYVTIAKDLPDTGSILWRQRRRTWTTPEDSGSHAILNAHVGSNFFSIYKAGGGALENRFYLGWYPNEEQRLLVPAGTHGDFWNGASHWDPYADNLMYYWDQPTGLQGLAMNGQPVMSQTVPFTTFPTSPLWVGRNPDGGDGADCAIYDLQIWSRVISLAEFRFYNHGWPIPTATGLIHRWILQANYNDSVGAINATNSAADFNPFWAWNNTTPTWLRVGENYGPISVELTGAPDDTDVDYVGIETPDTDTEFPTSASSATFDSVVPSQPGMVGIRIRPDVADPPLPYLGPFKGWDVGDVRVLDEQGMQTRNRPRGSLVNLYWRLCTGLFTAPAQTVSNHRAQNNAIIETPTAGEAFEVGLTDPLGLTKLQYAYGADISGELPDLYELEPSDDVEVVVPPGRFDGAKIIYARLKSIAGVTAIVGAGDAARIWPHDQPPAERVYPLIAYRCTVDDDGDMLSPGAMRLVSERIAIACIAETFDQAKALAAAVCGDSTAPALNNQSGTWGGAVVQGCFREDDNQTVQTLSEADRQFTIVEDEYLLWYVKSES